jgi:hypothetical protein
MPLKFLTRLTKGAGHCHIFYVPKYVKEFYGLKSGSYMGGVTQKNGSSTGCRIDLSIYRNTLRGRIPEETGFSKSIVEIWMYPHTWKPLVTIESAKMTIMRERQCEKRYAPIASID